VVFVKNKCLAFPDRCLCSIILSQKPYFLSRFPGGILFGAGQTVLKRQGASTPPFLKKITITNF
jgi:hypothetical protein